LINLYDMYKPLIAIAITACLLSCTQKHQAQQKDYILGNWVEVANNFQLTRNGRRIPTPVMVKQGFIFHADQTYENKLGYFYVDTNRNKRIYSGNPGKFQISGDSLLLFPPDNNKRERFRLVKVNADSLLIEQDSVVTTLKHYQIKINAPAFDKIILSTTGCFGTCAALDIMISADGKVLFYGGYYAYVKGWQTGTIPVSQYEHLQNEFRQVDFDSLKTAYNSGWTDQQTVYATFVKNNKIYKSVRDYGHAAPYLFEWAYEPLQYLYQGIKLTGMPKPDSIPPFEILAHYGDRKGSIIKLKDSEQFLLIDYLHHGKKVVETNFKPRFDLLDDYKTDGIKTDGRYYTFSLNSKTETIDIGFNFFDANSKNWQWQKRD